MEMILSYLPKNIANMINELPASLSGQMEEIRMRINRPLEIYANGVPYFSDYIVSHGDTERFIERLANHSFYTLDEELQKGYVTIPGGHRVGLAGKVILENGNVKVIKHLSSFNIRIAREAIGVANKYISFLYEKGWKHTMIIGAPQTGKTTVLRDIARLISTGIPNKNIPPKKVGIVDERSEIAGCVNGVPQLQFGPRIDVLDACPKAEGMMMLIRSMSPDVLIVDEIGGENDCAAILEAVNAGITLVMTTHGSSLQEIKKRPTLLKILQHQVFQRFIELSHGREPGKVASIRDQQGRALKISECAY